MNSKLLVTPGFLSKQEQRGHPVPVGPISHKLFSAAKANPSWIVGDTTLRTEKTDDDGRTMRIPAPFRFYAIRDEHPNKCGWVAAMLMRKED